MNPEELLEHVADILEVKRPTASGTYTLYVLNGEIRLGERLTHRAEPYVIAQLHAVDINKGPAPMMWDFILTRIHKFKKRGIL